MVSHSQTLRLTYINSAKTMKPYTYILICAAAVAITSCGGVTPTQPVDYSNEFTTCYVERYGQFYDSLPRNVFALDLYTEGVSLDSTQHIVGSGTNLYISDIFLSDSLFAQGTYFSDTTTAEHTFLPGQNFEGTPTGIYLLSIAESAVAGIQVLDSGQFTVMQTPDSLYDIRFTLYRGKQQYSGHFEGALHYNDKRLSDQ